MGIAIGARSKAEINITPMIDVLLVLIIIFMVITPLTPAGLRTLIPQLPDAARHESSNDIVVSVEPDGSIRLNAERVQLLALYERLSQIYRARGDMVLSYGAMNGWSFGRLPRSSISPKEPDCSGLR